MKNIKQFDKVYLFSYIYLLTRLCTKLKDLLRLIAIWDFMIWCGNQKEEDKEWILFCSFDLRVYLEYASMAS